MYCQYRHGLRWIELPRLGLEKPSELLTCLTVAEKALLWQAPSTGLEASIVLEASMIYTGSTELELGWGREVGGVANVECGQMDGYG